MSTRIYIVSEKSGTNRARLVRAISKAQAIRFVAEQTIAASIASQDDIVDAMTVGAAIETAIEPAEQE